MQSSIPSISIVIPTYGRDEVLLNSIEAILSLPIQAAELLVVDQTPRHDQATEKKLESLAADGKIQWIRGLPPSITASMNHGLQQAKSTHVLFLDDDIVPHEHLIAAHRREHTADPSLWATVGQVIQPWQKPEDLPAIRKTQGLKLDFDFPFHSSRTMPVSNVMAGNLCVHRQRALSIGGFDTNFRGAAYRFETEFARRIERGGGKILFVGDAGIDHLRAERGGTRQQGSHLTSSSPEHGIGDYYYAYLHGGSEAFKYSLKRFFREVSTKFHLTHPWYIPIKLLGEYRAWRLGFRAAKAKLAEKKTELAS